MGSRRGAAVLAGLLVAAAPASHRLTERELAAIAGAPFDQRALMGRRVVLGTLDGVPVVADHPCSDLCPAYTRRIIHYDLPVGPACAAAGGVEVERIVPVSIAVTRRRFCVPAAIAGLPEPQPNGPPR